MARAAMNSRVQNDRICEPLSEIASAAARPRQW